MKNKPRKHFQQKGKKKNNHEKGAPVILTGSISISARGTGYFRSDPKKDSIIIENEDLGTALHGDVVEINLDARRAGRDQKGKVRKIVSRSKAGFAGTLRHSEGIYTLLADDQRMYRTITIPKEELNGGKAGEKVFVEITKWENAKDTPIGKVVKVLGMAGHNNAEMLGIALERGFSEDFPKDVLAEAHAYEKKGISEIDYTGRRDMRKVPTCTIDPYDAKDFDDALSIKTLESGDFEIGIHIADVSHYVRPSMALDREAFNRGTSVYLVDRTIPMLPEALSNDLCSLKPNVDRLAMSTIVTMSSSAHVKDVWYGKTVIHSIKRFSYEEAQEVLDKGEGPMLNELTTLNILAKKLLAKREASGTLILDTDEVKFELDKNGKPLRAFRKVRGDTHKLIEEFMLLANKKVAEVFKNSEKRGGIGVYRIHGLPDSDKIADFTYLVEKLGYTVPKGKMHPKLFTELLDTLAGAPEKDLITHVLIRSMAKAIYSTKNIGHFGLGFEDYTHFTSPIRRYPDLMVHRLLQAVLLHKPITTKEQKNFERMSMFASERERNAAEAERASIKYKQVEYMATRIGEIYTGVITGVIERGIFVEELETKSEGMIQLKDLTDDFYTLAEKDLSVIGKKTKKRYRVGDTVKIKVLRADLIDRVIDYGLVKE